MVSGEDSGYKLRLIHQSVNAELQSEAEAREASCSGVKWIENALFTVTSVLGLSWIHRKEDKSPAVEGGGLRFSLYFSLITKAWEATAKCDDFPTFWTERRVLLVRCSAAQSLMWIGILWESYKAYSDPVGRVRGEDTEILYHKYLPGDSNALRTMLWIAKHLSPKVFQNSQIYLSFHPHHSPRKIWIELYCLLPWNTKIHFSAFLSFWIYSLI